MDKLKETLVVLNKVFQTIPLVQVMTRPAVTINVDEDFSRVEEAFINKHVRYLPVVDQNKELVGIISQKDIYRHIAPRRSPEGNIIYREGIIIDEDGYYEKESLNQYLLNYVMRRNPIVTTKDKTLGDAVHLMFVNQIGCVPIVDEKRHVVGIITRIDILKLLDLYRS